MPVKLHCKINTLTQLLQLVSLYSANLNTAVKLGAMRAVGKKLKLLAAAQIKGRECIHFCFLFHCAFTVYLVHTYAEGIKMQEMKVSMATGY